MPSIVKAVLDPLSRHTNSSDIDEPSATLGSQAVIPLVSSELQLVIVLLLHDSYNCLALFASLYNSYASPCGTKRYFADCFTLFATLQNFTNLSINSNHM